MNQKVLLNRYIEPLLEGRRSTCRDLVDSVLGSGAKPQAVITDLIWPAMEAVDQLYRDDRINAATEHMATRINRVITDQLQARVEKAPSNGRRVIVVCADDEPEELGAQMCADLFEADGWEVFFLGGGVPDDEVTQLTGKLQPHLLLIYGSKPTDTPGIRNLVTNIRSIGANPTMNIMVSGGVFNRADGLWQEVQANLYAPSATDAIEMARDMSPPSTTPVPRPGTPKKRRRRKASAPRTSQAAEAISA